MTDVPLGFGTSAKSTNDARAMDPGGIVVFHQACLSLHILSVVPLHGDMMRRFLFVISFNVGSASCQTHTDLRCCSHCLCPDLRVAGLALSSR